MTATATRTLAGVALLAGALALVPATASAATGPSATASATTSAAQAQAPKKWGVYYAPNRGAKAYGKLSAAPKDRLGDPTPLVKVTGTVVDLKRSRSSCGWAIFSIAYDDGKNNVPSTERIFVNCAYGKPKKFAFTFRNVYTVYFKVCAEPRAEEPSLTCRYGEGSKILYSYLEG
jgi:hypothetical protein